MEIIITGLVVEAAVLTTVLVLTGLMGASVVVAEVLAITKMVLVAAPL